MFRFKLGAVRAMGVAALLGFGGPAVAQNLPAPPIPAALDVESKAIADVAPQGVAPTAPADCPPAPPECACAVHIRLEEGAARAAVPAHRQLPGPARPGRGTTPPSTNSAASA